MFEFQTLKEPKSNMKNTEYVLSSKLTRNLKFENIHFVIAMRTAS